MLRLFSTLALLLLPAAAHADPVTIVAALSSIASAVTVQSVLYVAALIPGATRSARWRRRPPAPSPSGGDDRADGGETRS